jgi:transposase
MNHQNSPVHIGIDVAKSELVLDLLNVIHRLPNSTSAIGNLLKTLASRPDASRLHLICEPSGGYEQTLVRAALKAGFTISLVQPLRVRRYAQALGILAKSDPIDAKLLSRFGADLKPMPLAPQDEDRLKLTELLNRRDELINTLQRERNRAEHHRDPLCLRQHRALVKMLEKHLAQIKDACDRLIASSSSLKKTRALLCNVQGVGQLTSAILMAQLPELGHASRSQITALAGLAPYDRDSGSISKKRFIHGGRTKVRRILYMAALTASRFNPVLIPVYQNLLARGKSKKLALIAIARKLLIHLNSLLSRQLKSSLAF